MFGSFVNIDIIRSFGDTSELFIVVSPPMLRNTVLVLNNIIKNRRWFKWVSLKLR